MNTNQQAHLGNDMAKDKFDAALLIEDSVHRATFPNNARGYADLLAWLQARLKSLTDVRVCLEATGRYSNALALFLHEHRIAVSVVNPLAIYHFARSELSRTKTDPHDALLIARYSREKQPRLWQPPAAYQQRLGELVRVREQFVSHRVLVNNQKEEAPPSLRRLFTSQIRMLSRQIEHLERQIDQCIKENPGLQQACDWVESIGGMGRISSATVLSVMPPVDQLTSARQLAAFAGVTPCHKQSGKSQGRTKLSKLGHPRLRKALYFPAIVAMRCNPVVRALAERLAKKGKPKMSIIGACMRQLLHLIYGVLKNQTPFDPNHNHNRCQLKRVAGGCEPQLAPATV